MPRPSRVGIIHLTLAAFVVALLIGWIALDYRAQKARLRLLEQSGIVRRSGRAATDLR